MIPPLSSVPISDTLEHYAAICRGYFFGMVLSLHAVRLHGHGGQRFGNGFAGHDANVAKKEWEKSDYIAVLCKIPTALRYVRCKTRFRGAAAITEARVDFLYRQAA